MQNPKGPNEKCNLIVLTGGPGAGKTAVLEAAKVFFPPHVALFPEAASIIYGGGFWRLNSVSARLAAQSAIFHTQREMENLVQGESTWNYGICDRGTLDGLAYWPQSDESFWETFKTTKEKEFSRYRAVIHLHTPNIDEGYNYQNPVRIESAKEANQIGKKIHEIWKTHPGYCEIKNEKTFLEKLMNALMAIDSVIRQISTERERNDSVDGSIRK